MARARGIKQPHPLSVAALAGQRLAVRTDARGIKKPHPLGRVRSGSGVSLLTAEGGVTTSTALGVKISALPAASGANDTDQLEVNQAGTSRRVTLDQMVSLVGTDFLPLAGGTLSGDLRVGDTTPGEVWIGQEGWISIQSSTPGWAGWDLKRSDNAADQQLWQAFVTNTPGNLSLSALDDAAAPQYVWLFNRDGSTTLPGALTGTTANFSSAPTYPDDTTSIATTAFVTDAIGALPPPVSDWDDITGKPTTFPPTVPIAWADISGEPSTFPPSTHSHPSTEITDFAEATDDRVAAFLVAGANVTLTHNDAANTLTIASTAAGGGGGTVTSVSVASANGLAGTVATPTLTPAITLSTTVNGMVKGNATALSAAVAGTDYMTPANVSAAYQPLDADLTAIGGLSAAAGYLVKTAADTWTRRTLTGTASRLSVTNGDGTTGNPVFNIDTGYVGQSSITTLGTIGTGTWQGTVVAGQYGGTGVANTGKTITLGGNLTTAGAFAATFTLTGTTGVTFPTTGTLATTTNLASYLPLTGGTLAGPGTLTGTTGQFTRLGVGMAPSATATSKTWTDGDITMSGTNHFIGGNLYYDSGWKYTANGTGAGVALGANPTTSLAVYSAPNNAGGAAAAASVATALSMDAAGAMTLFQPLTGTNGTFRSADDIVANPIVSFYTNNTTQGVGIHYSGIRKLASTADSDIYMDAKGTGNIGFGYNSSGYILFNRPLIASAGNGATFGAAVLPGADNSYSLGNASVRWSTVWAGTGTIQTSGYDEKTEISDPSDAERKAAARINAIGPKRYKFKDAVAAKGDEARLHFGFIAEDVRDALAAEGLDPWAYGMLCADPVMVKEPGEGEAAMPREVPLLDDAGNAVMRLGLRYDELHSFLMAASSLEVAT